MTKRFKLDEESYTITDKETGQTWSGTGGSDGVPMLIDLVNDLLEKKKELEERVTSFSSKNWAVIQTIIEYKTTSKYKNADEVIDKLQEELNVVMIDD